MRASRFSDVIVGHGEGPVWWPAEGLRITDAYRGDVVSVDAGGRVSGRTHVGSFVGAFRPRVEGGLVAGALRSLVLVGAEGDAEDLGPLWSAENLRLNDGATDPQGRFYCGSMQTDDGSGDASLYRLDADRTVSTVITSVTVSNGLGWSPDGSRVYYVDTPTHRVDVLDVDAGGGWQQRRRLADLGEDSPDGLTVDADGRLWVAVWGSGEVRCLDADTGAVLEVVEVAGASQTSACTFGGPDLDQLFITTSDEGGQGGPLAGSLFVVEPGVRGLLPVPFAG